MYKGKFYSTIQKCKKNKLKYTIYTDIPFSIEYGAVSYMKIYEDCANYATTITDIDEDGVEFKMEMKGRGDTKYKVIPFENILCIEMNE